MGNHKIAIFSETSLENSEGKIQQLYKKVEKYIQQGQKFSKWIAMDMFVNLYFQDEYQSVLSVK